MSKRHGKGKVNINAPRKPNPVGFVKRTNFRKAPAKIKVNGAKVQILCPFCQQEHDIGIIPATCGTKIQVFAIQEIIKGVACDLCGETKGDKIKIGDMYRCAVPCRNDMTIYTVPPKKSILAALAYKVLPKPMHLGLAKKIKKIPVELSRGGKVTGYTWQDVKQT